MVLALGAIVSGLATYFDGSLDGLDRFARGEGVAAGLHVVLGEGWEQLGLEAGAALRQEPLL